MNDIADTIAKLVGAQLRWLREERSLTQTTVARLAGIPRPVVGRTERGSHVPTLETVSRLAAAIGVDPIVDVLVVLEPRFPGLLALLQPQTRRVVVRAEID